MSHNPSRADRSEYRKAGRSSSFNQQRFSGGGGGTNGGGAGGAGASAVQLNNSNRSFKKNNAQGWQSTGRSPNVDFNNSSAPRDVQNGVHQGQQTRRVPDTPVTSTSPNVMQVDAPSQKITQAVPRAPPSNVSASAPPSNVSKASSESKAPTTPAKAPGDASKSFHLQFGSISPGFVNGMQIPARTSSAPPNLDEQKKDQAHHHALRATPAMPIPSIPKQPLPRKDGRIIDQPSAGKAEPASKSKRETHVTQAVSQIPKPSHHPISGMPMQLPFHQPHVPVQLGGPNPHIHSQAMSGTSLPMLMSLPIGSPPQHSMFFPHLQPHPMQSQVMMHQGQSLNFSSQMGHQLHPQLGNMGVNMGQQYPRQAAVKFSPSRKAVKITHPDTDEELWLDSSPGPRFHPNIPPQSQPTPSFPPNIPMDFYSNPYNATPHFYPGTSSVPLNNTQAPATSQPPRVLNQVTVKSPVGSHGEKEPRSALSVGQIESSKPTRLHGEDLVRHHKEVEPSSLNSLPHSKPALGTSSASASVPIDGSASPSVRTSDGANIGVAMTDSIKDEHKETGNRSQQDQIDGPSTSLSSLPSQLTEAEATKTKSTSSGTNLVTETANISLSTSVAAYREASNLTKEGAIEENTGDTSKGLGRKDVTSIQPMPEITGTKDIEESSNQEVTSATGGLFGQKQEMTEERSGCPSDDVKMDNNLVVSTQISDGENATVTGVLMQDERISTSDNLLSGRDSIGKREPADIKCPPVDQESVPENEVDKNSADIVSPPSSSKDKFVSDTNVAKNVVPRGKKKKDLYRKAEAAGTSSDLYNAYKGPEGKKEVSSAEGSENTSSISVMPTSSDVSQENTVPCEKPVQSKVEPDDWEDAAEISNPKLETSENGDGDGLTTKKYSRDFLLKFVEQCTDIPEGFEIAPDIADSLMVSGINKSRESHPSPGRNIDRTVGGPRLDRRGNGLGDEDKWNKFPGPLMPGRGDVGHPFNIHGLRPGQGGNHGVLRNPRAQSPLQYVGGIISGPMQSLGPHGVLQGNNSDSDRWHRGTGFQKGLMPYPQTQMPVMHKAEKKYEVGKITDEEEAKQRQLKGILNKLTPQNFEKLFEQVKQVNIDNEVTLSGVISQIFDKALMEPTFCEMYANFCFQLAADLPDLIVDNQKITFKRMLLNKCQEEFERGEREEEEANKVEEEGEVKQTAEEREEKRLRVRRRMLGNIRLIGELYKKKMLTEKIMHECMNKLLGQYQNPDEENIEALCKLMSTIGEIIDHPRAKEHMDAYFDIMFQLSNNMKLSSRVRFMLKDAIDLRKNNWQQRRKVEGPKKIEEVHRDAAQERQAQSSRLSRAPSMGSSVRRGPPMDFSPRSPSMLPSQVGGYRAAPLQQRGYGSSQDAWMNERHFENRTMSVTLPQRPLGGDSITLGPQGGLARGMAFRGQQSTPGQNGFSSIPERAAYGQRDDGMPRYVPDRLAATPVYEQVHPQEQSNYGNREVRSTDRGFDRSLLTSPSGRGAPLSTQNLPSETIWPEEHLRDKSVATIKEFYSARDENEVALCIKDLNTPSFYPSMISIWVADSFERKDMERDLLTKLLINLTKPRDGMITEDQLIKGFESVLAVLEDAVNDAPRAAEFLGRIFAKVILENVISLSEIGRLIYEGGEEEGRLVEIGLAAEVLGAVLDIIKSEKGDSVLNEIRSGSNMQLEHFRPPGSSKSLRIDKFI